MLKKITIISSLLIAANAFAGKDGKDYFILKSSNMELKSQEDICSMEFRISKGKDGKDYFVLKNGIVFSAEAYPCTN